MANEIERKFLVNPDAIPSYLLSIAEKRDIEQAYIPVDNPELEVRVRKSNDSYFVTNKQKIDEDLTIRREDEFEISKSEYQMLFNQRKDNIIHKTRYSFPYDNHNIEIDFYADALKGLVIAEVEFDNLDDAKNFNAPLWFGKEVTNDVSYKNKSLAKNGLPQISNEGKFWEIALTGGPCGGKSTFVSVCKRVLEGRGVKVIILPEVATEVMESGIKVQDIPNLKFQEIVIKKMLAAREAALIAAQCYRELGKDVLIMHDRGILDNKAYCSQKDWAELLNKLGLKDENLRQMYDAVFDIITPAYGAEDVWDKCHGNNPQRYEQTVEQARAAEDRTQNAWAGHHNLKSFGNKNGWDSKVNSMFEAVYSVMGQTLPIRTERKYLVSADGLNILESQPNCVVQNIEQTYLKSDNPNVERRAKKVQSGNDVSYYYTEKEGKGEDRIVREFMPKSESEYQLLLKQAMPNKKPIKKTRYNFPSNNQYFALDVFPENEFPQLKGRAILELKGLEKSGQEFVPPNGINVLEEITDNPKLTNFALATKHNGKFISR
ncbi:MAG: AAA family ATPase [Clostridiales bacterium]|jgi:CYTH domain-containing protein|nr:AAA family ATPase [Clostridiales bacterium]